MMLYVESGLTSLKGSVYKRQYKFWAKILKDIANDRHSSISQIYLQAMECNLSYIKHYVKLHNDFKDADECMRYYNQRDKTIRLQNIRTKGTENPESILGTYLQVNSTLISPLFYHKYICSEYERLILSKYRTGGNRLKIQMGRFEGLQRNNRLCNYQKATQTLKHVIFNCELTEAIRQKEFTATNVTEFFDDLRNASEKLREIEVILKLKY